jgi:hypothetical protein
MVQYPLLPPPPARRRMPRQFSISSIFVLTTVVAVGVSLFKKDGLGVLLFEDGGLFVLVGMLVAMLAIVGIAIALAKLPSPLAGAVCIATLIGLCAATIGISEHLFDVRVEIHRLLGPSLNKKKHVDLVVFWSCVAAASIGLGSMLGYAIARSRERN